jgi:8-oxo-dGTP pyrophosphatase MutT (NUDIX family)
MSWQKFMIVCLCIILNKQKVRIMLFPSAKVIIVHPENPERILLIKRNGYYEPVGGKLEVDFGAKKAESLESCTVREAKEELGIDIKIEGYVGSYYFFWSIDPSKFSSCAVFAGKLLAQDATFISNADTGEFEVLPAWVTRSDIRQQKMVIDPLFVGLINVLLTYCDKF